MAGKTHIEWTESTWNPITGCSKISPGCKNCYAERLSYRLNAMGSVRYTNNFNLTLHEDLIEIPLSWKKPRIIFVNSMSDLFHEKVPLEFIKKIFTVMNEASWHTFQILTKRSERLAHLSDKLIWPENVWVGVSVESQKYVSRIDDLRCVPAKIKFISFEPLLSNIINVDLSNINWVIVGGESGPKSRPIDPLWVREIRDNCINMKIPFFFKQWGGVRKKKNGKLLDGRIWMEKPLLSNVSTKYITEELKKVKVA
jgi:protein gp37